MTALYAVIAALLLLVGTFFEVVSRARIFRAEDGDEEGVHGEELRDTERAEYERRLFLSALRALEALSSVLIFFLVYRMMGDKWMLLPFALTVFLVSFFTYALPLAFSDSVLEYISPFALGAARALSIILFPIARPMMALGDLLYSLVSERKEAPTMTQEELISVVDEIEEEGGFDEEESEIIKGAIKFSESSAQNVLIPRIDVKAFDIDDGIDALLSDSELLEYTRFPVYEGSIDNIIGIMNTKRLASAIIGLSEDEKKAFDLRSILREPYYIHMARDLTSLLREFREEKRQMAIVVDEYGGTMGIITAEDIVEEIVGDIFDESDDIEREYTRSAVGYEVDGLMSVDDFRRLLEMPADFDSEYNTVGGWSAEMLEKLPEEGDTFTFENLEVTVMSIDGTRVERLSVKIIEPEDEEKEE